jgi:hypothetical protein
MFLQMKKFITMAMKLRILIENLNTFHSHALGNYVLYFDIYECMKVF